MKPETWIDAFSRERERMVRSQLRDRGIRDQRVLGAMASVPRHEFVAGELRAQAYEDHPLPIAEEQTISQPYIVALMLETLSLEPYFKVLEIGTGSGYLTALLSQLVAEVFTIERHAALAREAEDTLLRLGRRNVQFVIGDGSQGLREQAPYNAIVVSAAAPSIPQALVDQLAEGGRMIIPVGPANLQYLQLVRKMMGNPLVNVIEGCRFVPLIGESPDLP